LAFAAGGVVNDDEVLGALLDQPLDQGARLADLGEASDQYGRAVLDVGQGLSHRTDEFVDHRRSAAPAFSAADLIGSGGRGKHPTARLSPSPFGPRRRRAT